MKATLPRSEARIDLEALHNGIVEAARKAGDVALQSYRPGAETRAHIRWKDGVSPVTDADLAADSLIARSLAAFSGISVHSEEQPETWHPSASGLAFVVDPIDGTRNFIEGGDAWCITIGLLVDGIPMAGVVHVPTQGITYSAWRGGGAWRNGTPISHSDEEIRSNLCATGPRPAIEALARRLGQPIEPAKSIPALAHRVLAPLSGAADIALARSGGHDWDIVAADCILTEAGGALMTLGGEPPGYRLKGGEHPPLIAVGAGLREKIRGLLLTNPT